MIRNLGLALSAATLAAMLTTAARADNPQLPNLPNLNFLQYTGSAPKNYFTNVKPVGWTGGGNLIFIDSPTPGQDAAGPVYLQTWKDPGTLNIPGGYNYVEADGNPMYEDAFSYEVTGLTAGQTYSLSFYQAASQQSYPFSGDTTNQWIVSLGTSGLNVSINGDQGSYSNSDPLMHVPSESVVTWNQVTVNLTADSTSDLLSFLAWGDNGNTANLPPMAFLTGVDAASGLSAPEPAVWGLMLLGFGGMGAMLRSSRSAKRAAA